MSLHDVGCTHQALGTLQCGIEQIRAGGIGLLGPFPKRAIPSKEGIHSSKIIIIIIIIIIKAFDYNICVYI